MAAGVEHEIGEGPCVRGPRCRFGDLLVWTHGEGQRDAPLASTGQYGKAHLLACRFGIEGDIERGSRFDLLSVDRRDDVAGAKSSIGGRGSLRDLRYLCASGDLPS